MKKQKMLITLGGLVAAVAATATITVSILAADGGGDSAKEAVGTTEPAFDTGGPSSFDLGPGQTDGKGGVFVTNPDGDDGETDGPVLDPVDGVADGPVTGGPATGIPKPPDTEPLPTEEEHEEGVGPLGKFDGDVKLTGEVVSEDIFSVDGRVLEVNGKRVLVMDYGDAASLEAAAAAISPDGSSVGTHMLTWVGSPHFFRTETAIVLYVGESPTVIEALTEAIGPQFAGR